MASRDDIEFTYTSIDRIFRLSMGELADFSGALYDGDFSLTLEQAQARKHEYIAEQIETAGVNYFVADVAFGDLTFDDALRTTELLAHEVMPAFANRA